MERKSTVEEIRARFDQDVERFANLETGQSATMDAPLALELISRAAAAVNPGAQSLLDIGCGAGNYTLKLMRMLPIRTVTLVDLSRPMLDRAAGRIRAERAIEITGIQADVREFAPAPGQFDVAVAAATLHHLRGADEWRAVFATIYRSLKPGGSFWISDLVLHEPPALQAMMWERYGEYLVSLKGPEYRDHVFRYIEKEDTPRPLAWQLARLAEAGFAHVDVLHANTSFASFGAIRAAAPVDASSSR